jgi:hypothetical protein
MYIYITDDQPVIEGTLKELRNIAEYVSLARLGAIKEYELSLKATVSPYNGLLEKMVLDCNGSKIKGHVEGKTLKIEYSEETAEVMASYFEFEPNSEYGAHCHFDQYGNEDYFDVECIDMVVQLTAS